jgi:Tfp pilus assembly protein PilO
MALIPEKPTKRAALLIFVIVGAGLYFFYDSWYTPQREDADAMQARLEQLESANRRAQIVAARGSQDLIERLALYERHVATLETLIPQSHEVPALLNNMAMEARRSDIDLALMRPEPAETGTFYTKRSYEIGVIGEYHEQAVDYDAAVTARFRIQTYVLPGPGEVPPDVPQPEQPGAVSE